MQCSIIHCLFQKYVFLKVTTIVILRLKMRWVSLELLGKLIGLVLNAPWFKLIFFQLTKEKTKKIAKRVFKKNRLGAIRLLGFQKQPLLQNEPGCCRLILENILLFKIFRIWIIWLQIDKISKRNDVFCIISELN